MEEATRTVSVQIRADRPTGSLERNWRFIGYDENNYTHTPEGEALLQTFGAMEQAPCHVRTHHMLCTGNLHGVYKWGSTNAYSEDGDGNPRYDWQTVDRILDVLLAANCKPFFELGFMPFDLVDPACHAHIGEWQMHDAYKRTYWAYPPKDYRKWQDLIRELVTHCVERYGEAEVLGWYWELWNEPDIFYWQGTREAFLLLYDHTEKAVHDVLPMARLGGPGTTDPNPGSASLAFFEAFLSHCRTGRNGVTGEIGTRLDFVSFHTKGGGFPFRPDAPKETPTIGRQIAQVQTGLEAMNRHGYAGAEVVLTEADPDGWAAGGLHDNPNMRFRNTEYYATYVACGYHHIEQLARRWKSPVRPLAWAFLFRGERCFEGTRTFSTQGIDKPVLNVFRMFSRLGGTTCELVSSGERQQTPKQPMRGGEPPEVSGTATLLEDGGFAILLFSHHDDWDCQANSQVQVAIEGISGMAAYSSRVAPPAYRLTHLRIDRTHSNAHTIWQSLGSPEYPTAGQARLIRQREGLEQLEPDSMIPVVSDRLTMRFPMPAHAVSLLILQPVSDLDARLEM